MEEFVLGFDESRDRIGERFAFTDNGVVAGFDSHHAADAWGSGAV